MGDKLFQHLSSGVGILFSEVEGKPSAVIIVSNDLIDKGVTAENLAKIIGGFMGGGGGGKHHLATAGGKDIKSLKLVMEKTHELITDVLKG